MFVCGTEESHSPSHLQLGTCFTSLVFPFVFCPRTSSLVNVVAIRYWDEGKVGQVELNIIVFGNNKQVTVIIYYHDRACNNI